ncbi:MAG: cytochrome c oxidase subunit II [Actinobacteria bacterium]|nr:cytochrome c oxidase subunit II [Actinomycetota bacterium]
MTSNDNQKNNLRQIFWIWLAITVLGVVIGIYGTPWLMPTAASNTMHLSILTMVVFTVAAAPVAALVYSVVIVALTKWRYKGEGIPPDGPPIRGNSPVTSVWLVTSTLLTVFLLVWGLALLAVDNGTESKSEMTIDVTGQQWVWTFGYAGTQVHSHDLFLPVDTDVKFEVTSKDVVHGFWIVQMGIKVNANPGVITTTAVTPNRVGTFDIRCTEICGLNHAFMVTRVHVLTKKNFDHWLATQPATN